MCIRDRRARRAPLRFPRQVHALLGGALTLATRWRDVEPETAAAALRCASYVLKHAGDALLDAPSRLRAHYGPLLGHARAFVREGGARALAPLVRRLSPKPLVKHVDHQCEDLTKKPPQKYITIITIQSISAAAKCFVTTSSK